MNIAEKKLRQLLAEIDDAVDEANCELERAQELLVCVKTAIVPEKKP